MPMFPAAPAAETAAQRHARDLAARRGDNNGATLTNGEWVPNADGELDYVSATAAGGRNDREYDDRRGDHYLDENGDMQYDEDGRNSREYANRTTLVSAINGRVYEGAHLLQGSPIETAPTN